MAKIYLSELASTLAARAKIDKRTAQQFIAAVSETIQKGIVVDRQVKIKGLGTFKIVDVGARESVNVNTGERVLIGSHSKLAFTPDTAIKEAVNKPFSQFENVILNEGVDFDDVDNETEVPVAPVAPAEPVAPVIPDVPVEPVVPDAPDELVELVEPAVSDAPDELVELVEPVVSDAPDELVELVEPVVSDAPDAPEVPEVSDEPVDSDVSETQDEPESEEYPYDDDEQPAKSHHTKLWLFFVFLAFALGLAAGYFLGKWQSKPTPQPQKQEKTQTEVTTDSVAAKDTLNNVASETEETTQEETGLSDEDESRKYDEMDPRVRTGAYDIVGLDRTVVVKQGETTARIARRTLGEGMECYIEVFNGIKASTPLQPGTEIKIPALKVKSAVRNKLNQRQNIE